MLILMIRCYQRGRINTSDTANRSTPFRAIDQWQCYTKCNTCTVMCSEPNKFMELLAVVIAKLEFYPTTWSMELTFLLIRRLKAQRIQKPFSSNVLELWTIIDAKSRFSWWHGKPNALFQTQCDIWFKYLWEGAKIWPIFISSPYL